MLIHADVGLLALVAQGCPLTEFPHHRDESFDQSVRVNQCLRGVEPRLHESKIWTVACFFAPLLTFAWSIFEKGPVGNQHTPTMFPVWAHFGGVR